VRAFLTKDFLGGTLAMPVLATSEPSSVEGDNLIPYVRFLERRAWRAKIADDLEFESLEIQRALTQTLTSESCLGEDNRMEVSWSIAIRVES
jgi:hypothetical protein